MDHLVNVLVEPEPGPGQPRGWLACRNLQVQMQMQAQVLLQVPLQVHVQMQVQTQMLDADSGSMRIVASSQGRLRRERLPHHKLKTPSRPPRMVAPAGPAWMSNGSTLPAHQLVGPAQPPPLYSHL